MSGLSWEVCQNTQLDMTTEQLGRTFRDIANTPPGRNHYWKGCKRTSYLRWLLSGISIGAFVLRLLNRVLPMRRLHVYMLRKANRSDRQPTRHLIEDLRQGIMRLRHAQLRDRRLITATDAIKDLNALTIQPRLAPPVPPLDTGHTISLRFEGYDADIEQPCGSLDLQKEYGLQTTAPCHRQTQTCHGSLCSDLLFTLQFRRPPRSPV